MFTAIQLLEINIVYIFTAKLAEIYLGTIIEGSEYIDILKGVVKAAKDLHRPLLRLD